MRVLKYTYNISLIYEDIWSVICDALVLGGLRSVILEIVLVRIPVVTYAWDMRSVICDALVLGGLRSVIGDVISGVVLLNQMLGGIMH